MKDPFQPFDAETSALVHQLLTGTRHAALGVIAPDSGQPTVTRIAFALLDNVPHTLVSDLSSHGAPLKAGGVASLLIGEPGPKGDPLTHPRLTLQVQPEEVDKPAARDAWLTVYPKAKLYYDFADFHLFRLTPLSGLLNGGFGKAWRLTDSDLAAALA